MIEATGSTGIQFMRIGIFGGTFDPIHIGHLILAEACREACSLDLVQFVVAGEPPQRQAQNDCQTQARDGRTGDRREQRF